MDKATTTVMTEKATREWLRTYFFVKVGIGSDFQVVYNSKTTDCTIYEWSLDENVEVIEVYDGYDIDRDEHYYAYTVNFFEDKFSGTPYRTGTARVTA